MNDPVIYKIENNKYRLSMSDSDLYFFQGFSLGLDINLSIPEVYNIAIQGPKSELLLKKVFGKIFQI